jgi:hypothetical protein
MADIKLRDLQRRIRLLKGRFGDVESAEEWALAVSINAVPNSSWRSLGYGWLPGLQADRAVSDPDQQDEGQHD